jgi:cytochrome bd-type quinol oxidase subunit 2
MDKLLGNIIDDYTLYRIIQAIITILILVAVYLSIQITLALKFTKKSATDSKGAISQRKSFNRSTIFILIAGIFMLLHEFLEGFEKNVADYTTYELLELIALLGLVLFLYEWNKTLKKLKKGDFDPLLSRLP